MLGHRSSESKLDHERPILHTTSWNECRRRNPTPHPLHEEALHLTSCDANASNCPLQPPNLRIEFSSTPEAEQAAKPGLYPFILATLYQRADTAGHN
ncbi:hypothetical protein NDU88_001213 [Pleurodeles waltl]|uniref:Uncharacterized protein n=1 Tax=Pleurodeles waltl TaxID=8319 RepID=A0AAV7NF16_PLEWA|nr:hypothetical protein NDU88_001213 [Pleurodeles waltl]